MTHFFQELFEYTHHCNQNLLHAFIQNQDKTTEKSVKLINHILNAHQIWNNRINPNQPTFGVWQMHAIDDLKNIDQINFNQSLEILQKVDMNQDIQYTNSKGQSFINASRDILFHIINHSTYHRGQIATEFRNGGLDPLLTDYIFYKR